MIITQTYLIFTFDIIKLAMGFLLSATAALFFFQTQQFASSVWLKLPLSDAALDLWYKRRNGILTRCAVLILVIAAAFIPTFLTRLFPIENVDIGSPEAWTLRLIDWKVSNSYDEEIPNSVTTDRYLRYMIAGAKPNINMTRDLPVEYVAELSEEFLEKGGEVPDSVNFNLITSFDATAANMTMTGNDSETTYYAGINGQALQLPLVQQAFVSPTLTIGSNATNDGPELIQWMSQLVSSVITPPEYDGVQDNNATATVIIRHTKKKVAAIIDVHTRFMSFAVNSRGAKGKLEDELEEAFHWDTCYKTAYQNFSTSYPKGEAMWSRASTTKRHETEGVWEFVSCEVSTAHAYAVISRYQMTVTMRSMPTDIIGDGDVQGLVTTPLNNNLAISSQLLAYGSQLMVHDTYSSVHGRVSLNYSIPGSVPPIGVSSIYDQLLSVGSYDLGYAIQQPAYTGIGPMVLMASVVVVALALFIVNRMIISPHYAAPLADVLITTAERGGSTCEKIRHDLELNVCSDENHVYLIVPGSGEVTATLAAESELLLEGPKNLGPAKS
jgi:hypothetical protein